jgi:hypothetical protein
MTWAAIGSGMAARVSAPQLEQVRAWPRCSVMITAGSGISASWCQVGSGSPGVGPLGKGARQAAQLSGT